MSSIQDKRIFTGGMNSDDTPQFIAEGDYRSALNSRIGQSESDRSGAVENLKGNLELDTIALDVDAKVVGKVERRVNETTIYFISNPTSGLHKIVEYDPNNITNNPLGELVVLMESPTLNFSEQIQASITDNWLHWTDNTNEPRCIDIDKARRLDKAAEASLYFGIPEAGTNDIFSAFDQYTFSVENTDGTVILAPTTVITYDGSTINDIPTSVQAFVDAFNSSFSNYVASLCGRCEVLIQEVNPSGTSQGHINFFKISNSPDQKARMVMTNIYPKEIIEQHISIAKYPPKHNPVAGYESDDTFRRNLVSDSTFQFQYRIVYHGNKKSSWSPISNLPIPNFNCQGTQSSAQNCIDVDFTNGFFQDSDILNEIIRVEVGVKEHNEGDLRLVKTIDRCELGIHRQFIKFYNDGNYPVLDQAEAIKLFDSVPLKSKTLDAITPSNSKDGTRLFLGNNTEGYDNVCVNAVVNSTENPNTDTCGTYNISVRLKVWNEYVVLEKNKNQVIHQHSEVPFPVFGMIGADSINKDNQAAYEQYVPEAGWPIYLAGTDKWAITKQVNLPGADFWDAERRIYDSSTSGQRSDIKNNVMDTQEVWQECVIEGVKPGSYVIRVASHWCSFGDKLGKGDLYDLDDPDRKWQKTSTYVRYTNPDDTLPWQEHQFEIRLELPYIASGEVDIYAGDFQVQDCSAPFFLIGGSDDGAVSSGYIIDANGSPDPEDLLESPAVEQLPYRTFYGGVGLTATKYTDHNGFFFDPIVFNTNVSDIFGVVQIDYGDGFVNNSIYKTGWLDIETLDSSSLVNYHEAFKGHEEVIIPVSIENYRQCNSTHIEGTIVDQNGIGVPGVNVVYDNTGRVSVTDINGFYKILIYDFRNTNRNDGSLNLGNISNCCIDYGIFARVPAIVNVLGCDLHPAERNEGFALTLPAFPINILSATNQKRWKRGDRIDFGIIYYDDANRSTFVNTTDNLTARIPFWTENGFDGSYDISWEIHHEPPAWATHYQWVRTVGQVYQQYLQLFVNDVKYAQSYDLETGEADFVNYTEGTAKEIYFDIKSLLFYQETNSDSQLGYEFVEGDRLRVVRDKDGALMPDYFDLKIKAQRGDYLVTEVINSLPELEPGVMIEVYRHRLTNEDRIFYEFGECYGIENGLHLGSTQDQTAAVPATGTFQTGNTFFRQRMMRVDNRLKSYEMYVESRSVNDFYSSEDECIGRVNAVNKDAGQQHRPTSVRFSNVYRADQKINGLSKFEGLNSATFPWKYGELNKLVWNENVMLAIFRTETVTIYVGQSMLRDSEGQTLISIANDVIGQWRTLSGEYGTLHPESVALKDSRVYWYDHLKGEVLRYSNDGITPVSQYKMNRYFTDKTKAIEETDLCPAVYDDEFNEYILTLKDETISYDEDNNRWRSFYSFVPEIYSRVRQDRFVSFINGALWVHGVNPLYNNFYGLQYPQTVRIISNQYPSNAKVWTNMDIEAEIVDKTQLWFVPTILARTTDDLDQESNLIQEDFRLVEGSYAAAFLRDINSDGGLIEGDPLRSRYLDLTIQNNSDSFISTFAVNVYSIASEKSNRR